MSAPPDYAAANRALADLRRELSRMAYDDPRGGNFTLWDVYERALVAVDGSVQNHFERDRVRVALGAARKVIPLKGVAPETIRLLADGHPVTLDAVEASDI